MTDIHSGRIWVAIRTGLSMKREALKAAFNTPTYEVESSELDEIAREMTKIVESELEKATARKNKSYRTPPPRRSPYRTY